MMEQEATKNGTVDLDDMDSGDLDPNVRITSNDVAKFRRGPFDEATEQTKKKWFFVMLECMETINRDYGHDMGKYPRMGRLQIKKNVAEVTTYQEEAILYWHFYAYEERWHKDFWVKVDYKKQNSGSSPPIAKKKRRGEHKSRSKAAVMNELLQRINRSRGGQGNKNNKGGDWDKALLEEARARNDKWLQEKLQQADGSAEESASGSECQAFTARGGNEDPDHDGSAVVMMVDAEDFQVEKVPV